MLNRILYDVYHLGKEREVVRAVLIEGFDVSVRYYPVQNNIPSAYFT